MDRPPRINTELIPAHIVRYVEGELRLMPVLRSELDRLRRDVYEGGRMKDPQEGRGDRLSDPTASKVQRLLDSHLWRKTAGRFERIQAAVSGLTTEELRFIDLYYWRPKARASDVADALHMSRSGMFDLRRIVIAKLYDRIA